MTLLEQMGAITRDGRVSLPWVFLIIFGSFAVKTQISYAELGLIAIMTTALVIERILDARATQKELAEIRDSHNVRLMALEELAEKTKTLPHDFEGVQSQLNKVAASLVMMRG